MTQALVADRLAFPRELAVMCRWMVGLIWMGLAASLTQAAGPADPLLRLVPPEHGATLTVENLRDHAREIGESRLFGELGRLPLVRGWLESGRFRDLERSAREIEGVLGVPIVKVRDELIGDAMVLSLHPGPGGGPEKSSGLLLIRPRDRGLLSGLVDAFNVGQLRTGDLADVDRKVRGEVIYGVRRFKAGGKPSEYYVFLPGDIFAWSNSEGLLHAVIDRQVGGGPSLGEDKAFQKVRRGLPEKLAASLYFNPRFLERLGVGPIPPGQQRSMAMLRRYLASLDHLGLAIEFRNGVVLHSLEAINRTRLDPWLERWLTVPANPSSLFEQVPGSALAVVAAHVDYEALCEAIWDLTEERDRPRLSNFRLILRGLLLGRDPVLEVLPRLKPGLLAYLELRPRAGRPRYPIVAALDWADPPGSFELSGPIDNALRTVLALFTVLPNQQRNNLRVEARTVAGSKLTDLTDGDRSRLAYRVEAGRVVSGTAADAVARFGLVPPRDSTIVVVRAREFPSAETFAIVDLVRLVEEARLVRDLISARLAANSSRPVADVNRDLGNVLAVAELFRAAWFTSVAEPDASSIHRRIGMTAR